MKPLGESSAIIEVFLPNHGRHMGVVRGGGSRKMAASLQPGNQLGLTWRARLSEHLGTFNIEPLRSRSEIMTHPLALAAFSSICALLHIALPERDPHPELYHKTIRLVDKMAEDVSPDHWLFLYPLWEVFLLEEIGFGLDLMSCAITGTKDDLGYISPRTGRAVNKNAAGEWAEKLFPFSTALLAQTTPPYQKRSHDEISTALSITGHFLEREISSHQKSNILPEARTRLLTRLEKLANKQTTNSL